MLVLSGRICYHNNNVKYGAAWKEEHQWDSDFVKVSISAEDLESI